jgi:NAD(P)-dependent dehydrogenase (short-subunit alcohol dehydrogenase family)
MKVFITGASRGIGLFLMNRLSSNGYRVYGTYNSTQPDEPQSVQLSKVDVSSHADVSQWVQSNIDVGDKIIAINCAGTNYNAFAHKADAAQWKNVIDVNLVGPFNIINSVLPIMRESGYGRIINFSSIVAQKGIPGTSAYAASKSALWGLSKSVAVENASKGITINNLNLGYFDIGMISDVPEPILDSIKKTIPTKKLGDPQNIYSAVIFIIENDYLNGTSLDINGGLF